MNPLKLARAPEVPLLQAAGYLCAGRSRVSENLMVMHLPGVDPTPALSIDEERYVEDAVASLEGPAGYYGGVRYEIGEYQGVRIVCDGSVEPETMELRP